MKERMLSTETPLINNKSISITDFDSDIQKKILIKVAEFFNWDLVKTFTWFEYENPLLGYISPLSMIEMGKGEKLLKFIKSSLEGNLP